MKTLTVAPNGPVFPIGLAYVVSALKVAGHQVDCVNLKLSKVVSATGYDFLATGGLIAQNKQITETLSVATTPKYYHPSLNSTDFQTLICY